ncbi:MAG TPA: hypothetical protein VNT04_06535 [Gaiellaceae bacterium]|jgi:hypothetical protein|nr:hypothetical protein [Gaiellaceae bacterium]
MSELWVPGAPSADDFVTRVHQQIARFADAYGLDQARVEIELRDGALLVLDTISPEPGYGFVTLRPHPEDGGEREELIIPLASVARIRISPAEQEPQFGFALPDGASSPPPPS